MHANSVLLFQKYVIPVLRDGMKVLEIGPDDFPSTYQRLAGALKFECWDTLDTYNNPMLTYSNSREYEFQIQAESYDVVLSGQVIEHVRKPWLWIPELSRVTKIGGHVITINPVSWKFHEAPVDCWRIYPEGMRALYEDAGIKVSFSQCESLEMQGLRRYQAGVSIEHQNRRRRIISKIFGRLGFPVERAYDTITLGERQSAQNIAMTRLPI